MKTKNISVSFLLFGLVLAMTVLPGSAISNQQEKPPAVIIPPEVKAVLEQAVQTQERRQDIPFEFSRQLFLPTTTANLHTVFLFKAKNADLGFVPMVSTEVDLQAAEQDSFQETAAKMQARGNAFLQFRNKADKTIVKEVYIPYNFQIDGASYNPEEAVLCSTGYPLPVGDYLLAMALTSTDLQKIGVAFQEFTLPDPNSFTDSLGTTSVFFVRNIKRMQAPETRVEMHRGFFTYSVLEIDPNIEAIFAPNDSLDIFFYIFGTQPNPQNVFDIAVTYEVQQNDNAMIKYAAQNYNGPLVSQPLPLKRTVKIVTTKGDEKTETTEQKDLDAGDYVLVIDVVDNVSGKKIIEKVNFSVK
jgi:hypothetical protein